MKPWKDVWECVKCKKEIPYDQPIIIDGTKGFTTKEHDCGPGFTAMILRPGSKSARAFWDSVKDRFLGGGE